MSINRHFVALAVLIVLMMGSYGPYGQAAAQNRLAAATSVACVFPVIATGAWTKGEPEAAVKPAKLSFRFESIDTQEATAEVIGPFGPSHIVTRLSGEYLHFMQMFSAGPLYTTTIFNKATRAGKLQAVHTRHEYTDVSLPGFTSRPEQYYGECEVE